jgi:hypothetical protein
VTARRVLEVSKARQAARKAAEAAAEKGGA